VTDPILKSRKLTVPTTTFITHRTTVQERERLIDLNDQRSHGGQHQARKKNETRGRSVLSKMRVPPVLIVQITVQVLLALSLAATKTQAAKPNVALTRPLTRQHTPAHHGGVVKRLQRHRRRRNQVEITEDMLRQQWNAQSSSSSSSSHESNSSNSGSRYKYKSGGSTSNSQKYKYKSGGSGSSSSGSSSSSQRHKYKSGSTGSSSRTWGSSSSSSSSSDNSKSNSDSNDDSKSDSQDSDTNNSNDRKSSREEDDDKYMDVIYEEVGSYPPEIECEDLDERERAALIVTRLSTVSNPQVLQDVKTPQYEALVWIVNEDTKQLCPRDPFLIQRYVAALLYFSTNGEDWNNCSSVMMSPCPDRNGDSDISQRWLSGEHVCEWYGLRCNNDGEIASMDLKENKLDGRLLSELSELGELHVLNLRTNHLVGTIPASWGDSLHELRELHLGSNMLTGTLPSSLYDFKKLELLYVDSNKLTGPFLDNVEDLKYLREIFLNNNMFVGDIPDELGELENLGKLVDKDMFWQDIECVCCCRNVHYVDADLFFPRRTLFVLSDLHRQGQVAKERLSRRNAARSVRLAIANVGGGLFESTKAATDAMPGWMLHALLRRKWQQRW
jgi:hypothetical protein